MAQILAFPRRRIALCERLREAFESGPRERGDGYHRDGRVEVRRSSTTEVRAAVNGGTTYEVRLRCTAPDRAEASCSCPFAQSSGPCKHIWAVLAAADRDALLDGLSAHRPSLTLVDEARMVADEALLERGRAQGRVEVLLRQLGVRFGALEAGVADRVCTGSDEEVARWTERVLDAPSVDEVFAER